MLIRSGSGGPSWTGGAGCRDAVVMRWAFESAERCSARAGLGSETAGIPGGRISPENGEFRWLLGPRFLRALLAIISAVSSREGESSLGGRDTRHGSETSAKFVAAGRWENFTQPHGSPGWESAGCDYLSLRATRSLRFKARSWFDVVGGDGVILGLSRGWKPVGQELIDTFYLLLPG